MDTVKAARFTALKAKVKAEMLRRNQSGSVASYGGAAYDYTVAPAAGKTVRAEHRDKLVTPMRAINSTLVPASAGAIIKEDELANLETRVEAWAARHIDDQSGSDCTGGTCTGTCYTGCATGCSGCGSGCPNGCTGCGSGCPNGCTGCGSGCPNGCTGCGSGCPTGCTGCGDNCYGSCGLGCGGECDHSCQGCGDGCADTCGFCRGGCYPNCLCACDSVCSCSCVDQGIAE